MSVHDLVALILVASIAIDPLAIVVALTWLDRELTQTGGETLSAIQGAKIAIIAGYLLGKTTETKP